jgi:hypothetical protein
LTSPLSVGFLVVFSAFAIIYFLPVVGVLFR